MTKLSHYAVQILRGLVREERRGIKDGTIVYGGSHMQRETLDALDELDRLADAQEAGR